MSSSSSWDCYLIILIHSLVHGRENQEEPHFELLILGLQLTDKEATSEREGREKGQPREQQGYYKVETIKRYGESESSLPESR